MTRYDVVKKIKCAILCSAAAMTRQFEKFSEKFSNLSVATNGRAFAPDFESKADAFRDLYATNFTLYASAEKAFRNLIQLLLSSKGIESPKVTSRIKNREECIAKFKHKYKNRIEQKGIDYSISDHISDIIGVRVICLYETDIAIVESIIRDHFEIIEKTDKTELLYSDANSFGYKGLHLDLRLSGARRSLDEYVRFAHLRFELQIRSIVQDAWSEVDHKLKYKKSIPPELRRRIVRMAALFELADQEFVAVRDKTNELEAAAIAEENEAQPEINAEDKPLDAFSFLSIMSKFHPNYVFENIAVDGFVAEINRLKSDMTVREFKSAIEDYRNDIWEYKQVKRHEGININPYTEIRHVLYLHNPQLFDSIINPKQQASLIDWWNNG